MAEMSRKSVGHTRQLALSRLSRVGPEWKRSVGTERVTLQILNLRPPFLPASMLAGIILRSGAMQNAASEKAASTAAPGLQERIRGTVHTAGEPAYEEACRIWNAMIERRPTLVVRPNGPEDVAETI